MGFGLGLITGFAKQATEDIEKGKARGRDYITKMRDSHQARADEERKEHKEDFDNVADSLDALAGLDFINGNYDYARSVYAALGKNDEQVNQFVYTDKPKADAYAKADGKTVDWKTAVKIGASDVDADPMSRLQAINSFVKTRDGVYTGTIADTTIPRSGWMAMLGQKGEDGREAVEKHLAGLGYKLGDEVPLGPVVPANMKSSIIRPDWVAAAKLEDVDLRAKEAGIILTSAQTAHYQAQKLKLAAELEALPGESASKIARWNAAAESSLASAGFDRAKLRDFNNFNAKEKELTYKLTANKITRQAAGADPDATYSFYTVRESELVNSIAKLERTTQGLLGVDDVTNQEYKDAKAELKQVRVAMLTISPMLDSQGQTDVFNKMSVQGSFNTFYEQALGLMTNVEFQPGLQDRLAVVTKGSKLAGYRAFSQANNAFQSAFSWLPKDSFDAKKVNNVIAGLRKTVNISGRQFVEEEVRKYETKMTANAVAWKAKKSKGTKGTPPNTTGIEIQDFYVKDMIEDTKESSPTYGQMIPTLRPTSSREAIPYDSTGGAVLYRINHPEALKKVKHRRKDDLDTPYVDESAAYIMYAGNGEWIVPERKAQ